jgi:hypothetical protein
MLARVSLRAKDVHVKIAWAPLSYPKSIEVVASTPVKAGVTTAVTLFGVPRTIDANETG